MGKPNFSDDFKRDAVHQITVRGYAVREVSERLGVSTYSLYKWMKLYAKAASQTSSVDHEAENRRLKRELARMTEERDILKKAAVSSTGQRKGCIEPIRGRCITKCFSWARIQLQRHLVEIVLAEG
ncbi:Transposase and inactivated derivatives [Sulfitobacter litoralis]|uniref:Transposase and inactivated derivatives n=1 Tax=Sulfitobacter litoralis TaxID=335975 RepID=A0ABY0SW09_9RHOB|nr:Transposase and inactivated derivatives [Sulfitobacter litoralis]